MKSSKPRFHIHGEYDVLVLGGGINGAAIAACLSHHGYSVLLIDSEDFAGKTSQTSSNLIWGGIKYLENLEFSLVRKLCRSRNQLMKAFPSSVREVRFFVPFLKAHRWKLKRNGLVMLIGTWLYWMMGKFKTRRPALFGKKGIIKVGKTLQHNQFYGAVEYSDAYLPENDSRFVYQFIKKSQENGASVVNYLKLMGEKRESNGSKVYLLQDQINKKEITIKAKWLINSTGPWVEETNQILNVKSENHHIYSKGVHLIFPKLFPSSLNEKARENIVSLFDNENRLFFAIPMDHCTVVGTTDTQTDTPSAEVATEDREWIIDNINSFLDVNHKLKEKDIIAERCGVRPLLTKRNEEQDKDWLNLSRKHLIEIHPEYQTMSIFGGKITDCINVGEEVYEKLKKYLSSKHSSNQKWYGEDSLTIKKTLLEEFKGFTSLEPEITTLWFSRWWRRYGAGARGLIEIIEEKLRNSQQNKQLTSKIIEEVEDSGYCDVELEYIARNEKVVKLEDILRRRTKLALTVPQEKLLNNLFIRKLAKRYP